MTKTENYSSGGSVPANDQLLQVFLNNTGDSYVFLDKTLQVVYCNEAPTVSYYFDSRPATGRNVLDFIIPQKKEQFLGICNRVIAGHTVTDVLRVSDKHGAVNWIEKIFRPAKTNAGEITGIVIASKDITQSREKEEMLKISNERYELIARATSDAIWDYDAVTRQTYFNDSFTRYFGHEVNNGKNGHDIWEQHIHPDDKQRVLAKLHSALHGNADFWDDEYRFFLVDGSVARVYDRGVILRNEAGDAVRMIGSMQDITAQKVNEEKIALSEHRFRSLVQNGADLIGILDTAGNYTYVTPTVRQLGYEVDYLLGKSAFDFIHPDDLDRVAAIFQSLFSTEQAIIPAFRFKNGDGEWRWIETTAINMLDDPAIDGIVVNSRDITEKKTKDEALQKALNDLGKILDSSVDVIVVTDEQNRYVQVSAAAETVWGYKPAELIGKVCIDLVHPDDVKHTNEATEKVMKGARITNFENRYIRKDGTIVPLIWSAKWDKNEKVMYAIARDASEKIETEQALLRSEARYRELFENNPIPMFMFDLESSQFMMVNEAALELYGYTQEEFLSKKITDIRPKEEIPRFLNYLQEVQDKDEMRFAGEWRHLKKDGTPLDVEISTHHLMREGRLCRLSVVHDVTERNKARAELLKSEAMFRAISESFPNGIVSILDRDLRFIYVAGQELQNLHLPASYFVGKLYSDHFPDTDGFMLSEAGKVFGGETLVSELRFLDRNYLVSAVPLYELNGEIERILVVAQNITVQKKAQKEKEMLISELTKNIHDLRQFSYITSHNLRAPISNLIGLLSLVNMDTITDPDTAFLVSKFKESTYLLNDTVNDLLNILLIKNNVNVKREVFSLKQVWEDVCTSVSSQVKKAGATIHTEIRYDDEIVFNKSYAESILLNLLTNSLKYRDPHRPLEIRLATTRTTEYVVLEFSDNGIGINMEHHRDKIFGLYQRFHNYPDSKGLGLYIVHSQITALGGRIEVDSEADKGTSFKIYFKR